MRTNYNNCFIDCDDQYMHATVPCSGSITKYYNDNSPDEHAYCTANTNFYVNVSEECKENKPYIVLVPGWAVPPEDRSSGFEVFAYTDDGNFSITYIEH